jgi:hypothetical protein
MKIVLQMSNVHKFFHIPLDSSCQNPDSVEHPEAANMVNPERTK